MILFNTNGEKLYQNCKVLELLCENPDEIPLWIESFTKAMNFKENVNYKESVSFVDTEIYHKSCHLRWEGGNEGEVRKAWGMENG